MKLLVDCHVFDGKFQGTRTYLEGLYRCMTQYKDIDFYFAARDIDNLKSIFGEGENINYVRLQHGGSILRLSMDFPKIIKENNIDYAHFQYVVPFKKKCKFIDTVHDVLFMDFPQYFSKEYRIKNEILFRYSACHSDIILTVSDYSRKRVSKWFGIPSDNIKITENAVLPYNTDMALPDVNKKYGIGKYILTVGRIEPRKNYLLLLQSFVEQKLYEKECSLVMIGTPDLKYNEFTSYLNGLTPEIKHYIKILSVSFPELVSFYKHASLFVFPSLAEGFGIPPLEAITYGCPVLCSNTTAMKEFNFPKNMTFNPTDKEELKTKMQKMLQTPEYIKKDILENRFNWQHSASVLYRAILENNEAESAEKQ